jgi:glycosyltransferase involved in cell wall biosynthesis
MKISAFINCYNEEAEIIPLIQNLQDVDEIVVIDHESTDNTAKIARELGAKVFTKPLVTETVTKEDVATFKKDYGYTPLFKVGEKMWDGAKDFTQNVKYCTNDWVLWIDADERIQWNPKKVKDLMKNCDIVGCKFVNSHNEDKTEKSSFVQKKLFKKSKVKFSCRIHTIIVGEKACELYSNDMVIHHWSKPKEYRKDYVKRIEYAFLKEQSPRMNYYLAREYFHVLNYKRSLKWFDLYLSKSTFVPEISKAYMLMAGCNWQLGNHDESFINLFRSMQIFPSKLNFDMMAKMLDSIGSIYGNTWRKCLDVLPNQEL